MHVNTTTLDDAGRQWPLKSRSCRSGNGHRPLEASRRAQSSNNSMDTSGRRPRISLSCKRRYNSVLQRCSRAACLFLLACSCCCICLRISVCTFFFLLWVNSGPVMSKDAIIEGPHGRKPPKDSVNRGKATVTARTNRNWICN